MKRFGSRRGSALLIVLGMMAFIVVSAVAFSAYMRYSRLPSSYLRRTSSSRLLVKAGLAEAINKIDMSISNNPYPGVGGSSCNKWKNRVFLGSDNLASTDNTVSTLTMEGLAYLPPALINDVRYYSRRTPTAAWQTLNYDAGRYAFCAVDVSDCFDVNRMLANTGRTSGNNCITLSHAFENTSHNGYTIEPKKWDAFIEKYTGSDKIPFISVADLNLAMKANGGFDDLSPFCDYLKQANNAQFVKDNADGDRTVELQRNALFVTDSLFATTNSSTDVIDLTRKRDQPFANLRVMQDDDPERNDDTIDNIFERTHTQYKTSLDFPRIIQLYDYLDADSVPLSLVMPTVERTPMVTGVGLNADMKVIVEKKVSEPISTGKAPDGTPSGYVRVSVGTLKLAGQLGVKAGFVYPFKYDHGTTPTFNAQVAATITLVPKDSETKLRRGASVAPAVFARNTWTTSEKSPTTAKYGDEKTPVVLTMQSAPKRIALNKVTDEEDAVLSDLTFELGTFSVALTSEFDSDTLLNGAQIGDDFKKGTFRLVEKLNKDQSQVVEESFKTTLKPSKADLSGVEAIANEESEYVPVIQVWVRITDANNNVVDLVPACDADDAQESIVMKELYSQTARERPLLRFGGSDVKVSAAKGILDFGTKQATLSPTAYMADDPRFNFAPECMKAMDSFSGDFKTTWLEQQRSSTRDGDIFMTTSDAGYLQSVFELTALLDFDRDDIEASGFDGLKRDTFGRLAMEGAMWTTWSQFKTGDSAGYDITRNLRFADGGRGFRVNPYTDDLNVMMTALANTPIDWWAASTNDVDDVKAKMLEKLTEANKYTFSEFAENGKGVKVKHGTRSQPTGTMTELAQKFMSEFRSATDGNWQNAFDKLDWRTEDRIAGVDLGVTLHSVDKKFLHGFWRSCFANRQHLFLIFVRAEPMMMGGGSLGQTPPQLGARAVALVWRDPTRTVKDPSGPHRTRILFYRQFD